MKCMIEGCDREAKVRGWCKPHYVREWKRENVSIEAREGNEMYNTWANKKHKRVTEWNSFERFKADVGASPGPGYRLCRKDTKAIWGPDNVEWRVVELPKRGDETLKEYGNRASRKANLRRKYGITDEQYDAMLKAQNGACAICKRPERMFIGSTRTRLAVDHSHKTGKVRGLLCSTCNTALGAFGEDPERIRKAIEYIRLHRGEVHEISQGEHQHAD